MSRCLNKATLIGYLGADPRSTPSAAVPASPSSRSGPRAGGTTATAVRRRKPTGTACWCGTACQRRSASWRSTCGRVIASMWRRDRLPLLRDGQRRHPLDDGDQGVGDLGRGRVHRWRGAAGRPEHAQYSAFHSSAIAVDRLRSTPCSRSDPGECLLSAAVVFVAGGVVVATWTRWQRSHSRAASAREPSIATSPRARTCDQGPSRPSVHEGHGCGVSSTGGVGVMRRR